MTTDLFAVEPDRSEGVQPVEDEEQALIGLERFRRAVEGEAVPPLQLFQPGAPLFVAVVEGIFYSSGGHQRPVHVSGHTDVDPIARVEPLCEGVGGDSLTRSEISQLPRVEHAPR